MSHLFKIPDDISDLITLVPLGSDLMVSGAKSIFIFYTYRIEQIIITSITDNLNLWGNPQYT